MAGHVELTGATTTDPELLESRHAPTPPRRRRGRWVVLAVLVVAAAGWRPLGDWLATVQTRHIVEAYAAERELQWARADTIADVQGRLVWGDQELFADTVAAMNREQSQRLRHLAKTLRGDSWWTVDRDVQRTADQVCAALVMEAGDLERAGAGVDEYRLLDNRTYRALFALGDAVQRLAARHDVGAPSRHRVRYAAADALRSRLSAPIRANVPLRLVVTGRGQTTVIDLRDGRVVTLDDSASAVRPFAAVVLPPTPASPVGEIAETTIDGTTIARLDGGGRRDLGAGLLLPRAGDGAWFVSGRDVATVAAGAAPVHVGALPPGSSPVVAPQPGNSLLISSDGGTALWNPRSGMRIVLSGPADVPEVLGAAATSVVWTRDRRKGQPVSAVEVTDTTTGRTRHVSLSPPLPPIRPDGGGPPTRSYVAPDGTGLAVAVTGWLSRTYHADLRTGRTRLIHDAAEAFAWSPDGHWLAVVSRGAAEASLVHLWSTNGSVVKVARATFDLDTANVALIP